MRVTQQISMPLNDQYDVIVLGGGPSGCTAAAAAAREGAKTLLIEASGCLGGMGTLGLVPAWTPFSDKVKLIYGGYAKRVFQETKAGMKHIKPDALDWVPLDPEGLKRVYDRLVTGAGAEVLFDTTAAGLAMADEHTIDYVYVTNKAGFQAYRAPVYIDCTGDGDVAVWAGAEYRKGDNNGQMMPASLCFILSNVDEYGLQYNEQMHGSNLNSAIHPLLQSGEFPLIPDAHICPCHIGPSTVGFNAGHIFNMDSTDPLRVSQGLMLGRRMAEEFRRGLAKFHPEAFANAYLAATAPALGVRESRRITGDYELTIDDYLHRRRHADDICVNSYYIDIHNSEDGIEDSKKGLIDTDEVAHHYGPGEVHGVPYRCLTPKGIRNLLVAGKIISADQQVQASVRVMPCCLCTGEAAGIAAVLAQREAAGDMHLVDTGRLREKLLEYGAIL